MARFTFVGVGSATFDAEGNFCVTFTDTYTDLPVGVSAPTVIVLHEVGSFTEYDSATGVGDKSSTNCLGGQCHGATFDSTGAIPLNTVTAHVAVSDHGQRIDGVMTAFSGEPAEAFGGFSFAFAFLRY